MTSWFVSRHEGAVEWIKRKKITIDRFVPHLSAEEVAAGDLVYGILPLELAAEVCRRGARVFALCLAVSEGRRGKDMTAGELEDLGADLREFKVFKVEKEDEF